MANQYEGEWPPRKIGYGKAVWLFLSTPKGGGLALKLALMLGLPVSVADEPLDVIPGLDFITIGDDLLWVVVPAYLIIAPLVIMVKHNGVAKQYERRREELIREQRAEQQRRQRQQQFARTQQAPRPRQAQARYGGRG